MKLPTTTNTLQNETFLFLTNPFYTLWLWTGFCLICAKENLNNKIRKNDFQLVTHFPSWNFGTFHG